MTVTLANKTKSLVELSEEYREMIGYGLLMGYGTNTFWKLCYKYHSKPGMLWLSLTLQEKMLLWCVEHKFISDNEAKEKVLYYYENY